MSAIYIHGGRYITMDRHANETHTMRLYIHCVSEKHIPTFKLSVTLSNINGFSNFCTAGKCMKFAMKPIQHFPPRRRHVAPQPWEIKSSNFLPIFSKYGRKCEQLAF